MSDSVIDSVELFHVVLPPRREHKWTGATEPIGGYLLVKLIAHDGSCGWGECTALKDWAGEFGRYFGESVFIARTVIETYLAPAIHGVQASNIVEIHARMDRAVKGYPYAKAAIDMAAYDLAATQLGVPVHTLLGGAIRTRIPITHSIGFIPIEEAEKEAGKVVEEGIRTLKIKVGVDAERDVAVVKRVRQAVGASTDICIDANQGYATPGEAIRTFRLMESCRIKYFEQPVHGIDRVAEVARAIDAPVMADESAWNAHDVIEIAEKRAAQIVSIYTTKPGGLYRAMQVAAVCSAAGIVCNVNGSIETGVGNLANIQLAAAAEPVTLSCVIPVSTPAQAQRGQLAGIYYKDDLLAEPMVLREGALTLPSGPGMGMRLDDEKIQRFTVSKWPDA
jgi:muconate cycloisomerase